MGARRDLLVPESYHADRLGVTALSGYEASAIFLMLSKNSRKTNRKRSSRLKAKLKAKNKARRNRIYQRAK